MKSALVYSDRFGSVSFGPAHPMKPSRLTLTHELIKAAGLLSLPDAIVVEPRLADEKDLLLFHTTEYLRALEEADCGVAPESGPMHGLGFGDNPVFRGVYEWSRLYTGATICAAELVIKQKAKVAFNMAGGLHHAMSDRASGFCYINDAVVAIKRLVEDGLRVAYVDIDAHHGDGVEQAFYDTDRVLTISIHESGRTLFPGTGFTEEMGKGRGLGYAVNVPLPPGSGDELFVESFEGVVPELIEAFSPDVLFTQLGVDTFAKDPITHLRLSTSGFLRMVERFKTFDLPWVALGGGGYDVGSVARAWTLAWAKMIDRSVPERMPEEFMLRHSFDFDDDLFRTTPVQEAITPEERKKVRRDVELVKGRALGKIRGN